MPERYRIERDTLGELRVPADVMYGAHTQRAVDNFSISGLRLPGSFIRALARIKSAAATVNAESSGGMILEIRLNVLYLSPYRTLLTLHITSIKAHILFPLRAITPFPWKIQTETTG